MNLASCTASWLVRAWRAPTNVPVALLLMLFGSGCSDQVRMPTPEEMQAFEQSRATVVRIDMDRVESAKLKTGPYRVVQGDVLEFTMPVLLQAVTAKEVQAAQQQSPADTPYLCRVRDDGQIVLPAIGRMEVEGLSLARIEEKVSAAYRNYAVETPSVFVRVTEFNTAKVYISGAVAQPGVYRLASDQMTLSHLLTEAGGVAETGASQVRIVRAQDADTSAPDASSEPILLPIVHTNIPFEDLALLEGDTVILEQIQVPLFSVLGLVNEPGNFPYPPGAEYNLAQAIAYAGGLDPVAEPRYVTVYRLRDDGSIARVPFRLIEKNAFTEAMVTLILPGDVVAIEHTPRTRTNTAISNMVRINMGAYLHGSDLWD